MDNILWILATSSIMHNIYIYNEYVCVCVLSIEYNLNYGKLFTRAKVMVEHSFIHESNCRLAIHPTSA